MKIQIASDLHLEFPENREWLKEHPLKPAGDILLLAGDIISNQTEKTAAFFYDYLDTNFPCVVSTMGNHEFYKSGISYAYPSYFNRVTGNHFRVNNYTITLEGLKIIGSTLWSYIPKKRRAFLYHVMNDYHYIYQEKGPDKKRIQIKHTNLYHKISLDYITRELAKDFDGKVVVMTHHLPSFDCIIKEYDNQARIQNAFATDLNYLINDYSIDLWVFGHLHDSVDISIGKTRLICNPLGYMNEPQKDIFNNGLIVEL